MEDVAGDDGTKDRGIKPSTPVEDDESDAEETTEADDEDHNDDKESDNDGTPESEEVDDERNAPLEDPGYVPDDQEGEDQGGQRHSAAQVPHYQ